MKNLFSKIIALVALGTMLFACSGPEAKKMKFYSKGKSYYEKGDLARARLELKNALQIDGKFADAYALLGMVELKQGNLNGAFGPLTKATDLNPKNYDAQTQLGKIWLQRGDQVKAQEKVDLVLKAQPNHEEALLLQGAIYLVSKAPDKAITLLQEMVRRKVTRPEVYLLLASAYREAKNDKEIENVLREGITRNNSSSALHRAMADFFAGNRRIEEAAGEVRQLIKLEPANYNYSITLAGLYWDNGREPQARDILGKLPASYGNKEECILAVTGFYFSRRQLADAEKLLQVGIDKNKKSFTLRFSLADLFVKTGRVDKGIAILKECLGLEKDDANPQIINTKNALAQIYLGKNELAEAGRLVEEILKVSSRNLDANLTKGRLAMLKGQGDTAVAAFQTIVNDKPNMIQGYLLLADAQLLSQRPQMAQETLQQAQKQEPDSRDVQRAFSRFYMHQKDFRAAEGVLRKAMAKNPADLELQLDLGDLFRTAHDTKQAEAAYAGVKKTSQGAVIGRVKLSELYLEIGKPDRAMAELSQAVNLAPQSGELFAQLIRLYGREAKYAEAANICKKRITSNPQDALTYLLQGEIQGEQGEYRKAEESLLQAQKLSGNSEQATLTLAQLEVKAGEPQKARRIYEDFIAKKPDSVFAANDFACFLADHGNGNSDLQKAFTYAQQVSTRFPDNPSVMDTLGWVYYRQGDYRKASELLEQSAVKLSSRPQARYHTGMALYRAGMVDKAKSHLQYAVSCRESFTGKEEAAQLLKKY